MYCKVKGCRFPSSHVTLGHQCGKCGNFGHGVSECGKLELVMNLLLNFGSHRLTPQFQCQHSGCKYKDLHTNQGHKWEKWGDFHGLDECIIDNFTVKSLINSKELLLSCLPEGKHAHFYIGMGCKIYVKNYKGVISGIFMHADSWGQYGPKTDDTPKLDKFLKRTQLVDNIKCPICRNEGNNFELTKLVNNDDLSLQCSICLQNLNTKYVELNDCGHNISCIDCFKQYIKS